MGESEPADSNSTVPHTLDLTNYSWLHRQLQLEKLTASFQYVTEDLRRQFMVDGEPLLHENSIGSSPILASSFRRTTGFTVPDKPPMSTSGALPLCCSPMAWQSHVNL